MSACTCRYHPCLIILLCLFALPSVLHCFHNYFSSICYITITIVCCTNALSITFTTLIIGTETGESFGIPDTTLLSVANYTLNDEAGRVERLEGIETKFYSLQKYNVVATAFVFVTEVMRGKTEVFSFILVLPYSEMSDYLSRHSLCETRVQRILQNYFISPLQDMVRAYNSLLSLSTDKHCSFDNGICTPKEKEGIIYLQLAFT